MKVVSNRDWHRAIGDHGENCPLTGHDDLMMTPASDDQLPLMVRDWNARTDHSEQVLDMAPAGGEVEVLSYLYRHRAGGPWPRTYSARQYGLTDWAETELVDRAHVARLQAENDALQQRLNVADQRVDDMVTLLNLAENILAEQRQISPGYDWIDNNQQDREEMRKKIADYLTGLPAPSTNFIACKVDESCGHAAKDGEG